LIGYRSMPHGPLDMQVNTTHGGRIVLERAGWSRVGGPYSQLCAAAERPTDGGTDRTLIALNGAMDMFAQLMGLKTIAPDDLHRLSQDAGNVSIYDVNSRQSWIKLTFPVREPRPCRLRR
jgi:hypothetical protein